MFLEVKFSIYLNRRVFVMTIRNVSVLTNLSVLIDRRYNALNGGLLTG